MSFDQAMDTLGDPTRRAILGSLRHGPRSVADIAGNLPVSRPAVSQHLKILKAAGFVIDEKEGNKRLYGLSRTGFETARGYLASFDIT
jgi:DNA-binding transcriptional ArsR family regulator